MHIHGNKTAKLTARSPDATSISGGGDREFIVCLTRGLRLTAKMLAFGLAFFRHGLAASRSPREAKAVADLFQALSFGSTVVI
jgi:hypothetical protein